MRIASHLIDLDAPGVVMLQCDHGAIRGARTAELVSSGICLTAVLRPTQLKNPKGTSLSTKKSGKAHSKSSRCWPGYEPVLGKSEHEESSCRKKPASRNGGKDVDRETARRKQISLGGKRARQAKTKSSNASERRKAAA
jgi:hypothetical protein